MVLRLCGDSSETIHTRRPPSATNSCTLSPGQVAQPVQGGAGGLGQTEAALARQAAKLD